MFLAKAFQTDTRPQLEAETLSKAGHRLFVLAWDRYFQFQRAEDVGDAKVCSFNRVNVRKFSKLGLGLGAILFQIFLLLGSVRLITQLKQRPVIHSHDFNTLLPACFLRILRLSTGLVYDCHELSFAVYSEWFNPVLGSIVRMIEERAVRCVDAVITVSEPIAGYLRRFKQPTVLISNYPRIADAPRIPKRQIRARLGLPIDAFIVSYVGEIRYGCRLDLLLGAASRVEDVALHFVVVGGGPLAREFKQAASLTGDSRFTVLPQLARAKALQYVSASDLTWVIYQNLEVSLSERLAMPWKFFESLACGVPVIVNKNALIAEYVHDLRCGVILESLDPEYVSETLVAIARDVECHRKMRSAARKAASAFNWERVSQRLIDIYEFGCRHNT